MCGRFYLDADLNDILQHFNVHQIRSVQLHTGEIFPTEQVAVITEQPERQLVNMRWGWEASFLKKTLINARAETLLDKEFYRESIRTRRCIVPASGYYEWGMTGQGKQRYGIFVKDQPLIALAGLYQFQTTKAGEKISAVTIITKPAAHHIRSIHDRMPMMLGNQDFEKFLEVNLSDEALRELLSAEETRLQLQLLPLPEDKNAANDSR